MNSKMKKLFELKKGNRTIDVCKDGGFICICHTQQKEWILESELDKHLAWLERQGYSKY